MGMRLVGILLILFAIGFASEQKLFASNQAREAHAEELQVQLLGHLKAACPRRLGMPRNELLDCYRRARGTFNGSTVFIRTPLAEEEEEPKGPFKFIRLGAD